MSRILRIDNTEIEDTYVVEYTFALEGINFDNSFTTMDEISVSLDNIDPDIFDPRYTGSIFYGTAIIGLSIDLFDDEINRYLFSGKIKNFTIDESSNQINIDAISNLAEVLGKDCTYSNSTNKTIAECIYEILLTSDLITADDIVYAGFQKAINIHAANSAYVNIVYDEESTQEIGTVISELCRLGHCYLYSYQNLIYLWMYEAYAGQIGVSLANKDIIAGSYKEYFASDDLPIKNSYSIAYISSGTTVSYVTGTDAASIATYGANKFSVPDEDTDETSSSSFNIIFRNLIGATWSGALALSRFKNPLKFCEIDIYENMDYIHVGSQVDLHITPFYGEPCLVVEREFQLQEKTIKLKCLFLNTPTEVYTRDTTPPDPVTLVYSNPITNNSIKLEWTESTASDHFMYNVYFTATPGEWYSEYCNLGQSPIICKNTTLNSNGLIELTLSQLDPGLSYYFRITDVDTSFNESDWNLTGPAPAYTCVTDVVYNTHYETVTIGDNSTDTYPGCEDNFIYEPHNESTGFICDTTNYGTTPLLFLDSYTGERAYILIKFSGLSNIPSRATIISAAIYLKPLDTVGFAHIFSAYRLLRNWGEGNGYDETATTGESSWLCYAYPNTWETAGAEGASDRSQTASFSQSSTLANNTIYYSFTGTEFIDDVQKMVSGEYNNYGWLLKASKKDAPWMSYNIAFWSSEPGTGYRPYLQITYTI
jgi:hypothetical protein